MPASAYVMSMRSPPVSRMRSTVSAMRSKLRAGFRPGSWRGDGSDQLAVVVREFERAFRVAAGQVARAVADVGDDPVAPAFDRRAGGRLELGVRAAVEPRPQVDVGDRVADGPEVELGLPAEHRRAGRDEEDGGAVGLGLLGEGEN